VWYITLSLSLFYAFVCLCLAISSFDGLQHPVFEIKSLSTEKVCKEAFGVDKKAFKFEGELYCETHYTLKKAGKATSFD